MTLPLIQVYAYRDIGVTSSSGGGTSSAFNHNSVQIITSSMIGAAFPTKATAFPAVYDDGTHTVVGDLWDGAWPDGSAGAPYTVVYTSATGGVTPPHSHTANILAGRAGPNGSFNNGLNVIYWKNRTRGSLPTFSYLHWYMCVGSSWQFNLGAPNDNNFKLHDYSAGTGPYDANNWYLSYAAGVDSFVDTSSSPEYVWTDDSGTLENPDQNGHNIFWSSGANPGNGNWVKLQAEIRLSSGHDGFIRLYQNGLIKVNYLGITDAWSGTDRVDAIGGYNRSNPDIRNLRCYSDSVIDYALERVMLGNTGTYSTCTITEYQPASTWTASSITFTAKLGKMTNGSTGHLYVINSSSQATHVTTVIIGS